MGRSDGLAEYGFRYLDPRIGRWISRDPLGENWRTGEFNPYAFVTNSPLSWIDVLGQFKDGGWGWDDELVPTRQNPEGQRLRVWFNGHLDFANITKCPFDFSKEDHRIFTYPLFNPAVHFMPLEGKGGSRDQVEEAIRECDPKKFQSRMHRAQDYFSHYNKNYRWDPIKESVYIPGYGWGHLSDMGDTPKTNPDLDNEAWKDANRLTIDYLEKWLDRCQLKCCNKCKWVRKGRGRQCDIEIEEMGRHLIEGK